MSDLPVITPLTQLCKDLEAFQTPRWAIESVLDVELTTRWVHDPCVGLGAIANVCQLHGLRVTAEDIVDWSAHFPDLPQPNMPVVVSSFLESRQDLSSMTVMMNPPFSLAEAFVDHAQKLGARKIITFQRQAWRESGTRRLWWEQNAPARVWVCGARASCWRFDLLGAEIADKSGSPTSNAWYVWERGHKGAELTSAIYPRGTP